MSLTGYMASAIIPATIPINSAQNSHTAMDAMSEVAAFLHITEKNRDNASQNAIYTTVNSKNTKILAISSPVGKMPVQSIPTAATRIPMANTIMEMMVRPARNLPLMMASR